MSWCEIERSHSTMNPTFILLRVNSNCIAPFVVCIRETKIADRFAYKGKMSLEPKSGVPPRGHERTRNAGEACPHRFLIHTSTVGKCGIY